MLHAILYNKKLIGLFSDYNKCKLMINGLISNNFVKENQIIIKSFVNNSITERIYYPDNQDYSNYKNDSDISDISDISNISDDLDEIMEEFSSDNTTDSDNNILKEKKDKENKKSIIDNSKKEQKKEIKKEYNESEIQERCKIMNDINSLKKDKEKYEERKRVYEVDIDLYNRFKNILLENANFEIPEMFVDKYNLMKQLESEEQLSMDTFYKLYKPKPITTSFSKIFE
jgi:hypothetical protein